MMKDGGGSRGVVQARLRSTRRDIGGSGKEKFGYPSPEGTFDDSRSDFHGHQVGPN